MVPVNLDDGRCCPERASAVNPTPNIAALKRPRINRDALPGNRTPVKRRTMPKPACGRVLAQATAIHSANLGLKSLPLATGSQNGLRGTRRNSPSYAPSSAIPTRGSIEPMALLACTPWLRPGGPKPDLAYLEDAIQKHRDTGPSLAANPFLLPGLW